MNKALRISVGLFLSILFLWLALRNFSVDSLRAALKDPVYGWMIPTAVIFPIVHYIRSVRWAVLLSALGKVSAFRLFPAMLAGMFANNVLPARAGEVVRAFAASRQTGHKTAACLGSIVAERLSDMMALVVLALIAAQLLPSDAVPVGQLSFVLIAGIGGLTLALVIGKNMQARSESTGVLSKIFSFLSHLVAGFSALRSPTRIAGVMFAALLIWALETLAVASFSRAFHLDLTFQQSSALIVGLCLGTMIPAAPGFVGTFEFFGQRSLVLLGFPGDRALSFVLVLHFFQYTLMALLGIPALMKIGLGRAEMTQALSGKDL